MARKELIRRDSLERYQVAQKEKIRVDSPHRQRSVRDFTSAKTNAWGIVSVLLVISLIGTIFIAYANVSGSSDSISYFSPSGYLMNLSDSFYVPAGYYQLHYVADDALKAPAVQFYSAYIDIAGRRYYSNENKATYTDLFDRYYQFTFDVAGDVLLSGSVFDYYENDDFNHELFDGASLGLVRYLYIADPVILSNTMPDIGDVGEAWSGVRSIFDILPALRKTGNFIISSVQYEARLIDALMPWNSVKQADRNYLPDLWEAAEERNGF